MALAGAPVWIPARCCAPSGMTNGSALRAVLDDIKKKEKAVREDVPDQRCAPSGMTS